MHGLFALRYGYVFFTIKKTFDVPDFCPFPSSIVWDCFVVQVIILQISLDAAHREMTGSEGESAVKLFGIFMQLFETLWRNKLFWKIFLWKMSRQTNHQILNG